MATLHWVVVQKLSVEIALGRALSDEYWKTGKLSAELYLDDPDPEQRAWAHGSLAELWLLALANPKLVDPASEESCPQSSSPRPATSGNLSRSPELPGGFDSPPVPEVLRLVGNREFQELRDEFGVSVAGPLERFARHPGNRGGNLRDPQAQGKTRAGSGPEHCSSTDRRSATTAAA